MGCYEIRPMSCRFMDYKWGFPQIRGPVLGISIIRAIAFGGLCFGTPFYVNRQINPSALRGIQVETLSPTDV